MEFDSSEFAKLATKLAALTQKRATGKLILAQGERQWQFFFRLGQLVYATGGSHRVRRWKRGVSLFCPGFAADPNQLSSAHLWEYQLLHQGVTQEQLSLSQARGVIQSTVREVLFTMFGQTYLASRWFPSPRQPDSHKTLTLPLSSVEVKEVLQKTGETWQQWHAMGLSYISPDGAPVLKERSTAEPPVSSDTFFGMKTLFNGQNTLWDIALERKQSVTGVSRILHHFLQQGLIEVREVPDLLSPMDQFRLVSHAVNLSAPTIACIDDSAVVCHTLESILVPAGYQVLKIQQPLLEMPVLVKHKPALIFLDLVMPDADGHALCAFLRQTSVFRNTPVIILTGHDGVVERLRSKFTGASDFLSKPPDAKKVLEIVRKHLPVRSPASFPLAPSEIA
ncbi:response regulator [Kamptonema formosum]|uniref:response regulator n=1 Tax=Kamptonema formosum TaxID=331992 RepID=UPI000349EF07|nr:response regulator [Oscillatoria sp. PCC 10802]